ncbi:sensor histidine kinase [Actinoplanes regularis]|uniref:histidine kinase n=1 Tax=Actinoplanes regularis TaxID=52697 RepID=A0A238WDN8_9ACTN|nr:sensor histidine kinase [Actinoplanes regularis]GIE85006.1 hypothetical protein Are01nite_14860 [Actinoplanes regularis]SNR44471.1 Signal transduction histidine kinase [Actinoplanes regularis]
MSVPVPRRPAWLAWAGGLLFPIALFLAATAPGGDQSLRVALIGLSMLLPFGLLRRAPIAALLSILLGGVAVVLVLHNEWYGRTIAVIAAVVTYIAVGFVASARSRRVSILAAFLAAGVQVALSLIDWSGTAMPSVFTVEVMAVVTAWVIGYSVRQRRRYAAAEREQAEARAVQAERLRIARELHDLIAHSIGVIAVQAGVGRRVIDTQPAEARNSLATIEETSRETLAALRRILGSLRRSDPGPGTAPLDPAPGLADLDGLVGRTADAGVQVGLHRHGDPGPLPPDIDLSAFRVIQEAVTNVIRHAGTGRCDVTVDRRPGELSIEITDDGRGGEPGPGYGIPGMRERVSLLNGEFSAGPGPVGGFRVAARIPIPVEAR